MLQRLVHALIQTKNEAADDVLLEAARIGSEAEKRLSLDALFKRSTLRGLSGIVEGYERLPESLQLHVLGSVRVLHHALRECGRSSEIGTRQAAMKLIALGRQGKLAYVLSENLHDSNDLLSKSAAEALVALARWVATQTKKLQQSGPTDEAFASAEADPTSDGRTPNPPYDELMAQRPEIEAAIARAMNVHRGRHGQDLLRAALLLCDWPGSKTLAILHTTKHGGQSPMVRRLQQPPASEHVEAFLLGASHAGLRSHFGTVFSHINEAPVLDALLRKTHWLKDHQLQIAMHGVSRGTWWSDGDLSRDIERRVPEDAARIAEWLAVSGCHDVMQDERMERLRAHGAESFAARLRLLRIALGRKRGASCSLLRSFLMDPDERIVRMAARDIVRRRPNDFENMLLQLMTGAPESVRRVISRAIGQAGFEHFWHKFDRLPKGTRKQAGRAMLKLLPDAIARLERRLAGGPLEQRLKAMQITQELGLGEPLRTTIIQLTSDANPRLRSKAVAIAGDVPSIGPELLMDRLLNDTDARVRANTIEVLEQRNDDRFLPVLAQRARGASNRERANAIKALHRMRVSTASDQLMNMLRDERSDHRISALWALRQIGWWQLLGEVGKLAKADTNLRVRRYALAVLRGVADLAQQAKAAKVKASA